MAMTKRIENKQKILIVDDSEMNRSILIDILEEKFEIIEAVDGVQAVMMLQKLGTEVSLVLLDIVMPNMDGFEVLAYMNKHHWIDNIPVIMISAENTSLHMERAYELGVTDYISRPFDSLVVYRRAVNTIMLYAKQKKLAGMVADQIYEREKSNRLLINILSHIVEFRNGESGLHVLHISVMTELLLRQLLKKTDQYKLTEKDVSLISTASALHDIGKIAIPDSILNKPGKLTKEEFEIMKTHTTAGASMLDQLPFQTDEPLVKIAYQICRWHHERHDGRGYPDGLKGEEIPIAAQIVSLADVYDALTSKRVYKPAFSHEQAMQMIMNGECGTFSPLLLECLVDAQDQIRNELAVNSYNNNSRREMHRIVEEMTSYDELTTAEQNLRLLEYERSKFQFFNSVVDELQFEYMIESQILTLSKWGAKRLGVEETMMEPFEDPELRKIFGEENLTSLCSAIRQTTPDKPVIQYDMSLKRNGTDHVYRVIRRTIWSLGNDGRIESVIGRVKELQGGGNAPDGTVSYD